MTLVDDNQVEEIPWVVAVQTGSARIPGDSLVDGEIDLAALDGLALDLVAGIAEGGKGLVLGIVDQDVAIGEKENAGLAVRALPIPARVPELPADLEGHHCLTSTRRHGEQDAPRALQDRLHGPVDGDLLVVARGIAGDMVIRGQELVRETPFEPKSSLQPGEQLGGCREGRKLGLASGQEIEFDDPVAVGGIRELEAEDFGIVLRLLQTCARRIGFRFGLDHRDQEVTGIAEQIVRPLSIQTAGDIPPDLDSSESEGLLFRK